MIDEGDTGGWAPPDPAHGGRRDPLGPSGEPVNPAVPARHDPRPAQTSRPSPHPGESGYDEQAPHGAHGPVPNGRQPYGVPGYGQPYDVVPGGQPPPYGPYPYAQAPVGRRWVVEAPPGTPYHRLARTPVQRWWRSVLGTVAIVVSGLLLALPLIAVWTFLMAVTTGADPESIAEELAGQGDPGVSNTELGFTLFTVAVFLPVILPAAWVFQRRRPGSLSSVTGRLRWRWMLVCAGLAVLTSVASFVFAWAASALVDEPAAQEGAWVGWGTFWAPLLIVVLLVPFQAGAEEYFFRGWLLQAVGSCTLEGRTGPLARRLSVVFRTPWPAICVGSLAFVAVHGYTGWGVLAIFGFAAVAGWLTVRTGGLEAAIAVHVVNNLVAFLVPAAVGRLSLEQGAIPLPYVLADLLPLLLYAALAARLARRRDLQTVTG